MYTPVDPSFTIQKSGVRGYITHGDVILILLRLHNYVDVTVLITDLEDSRHVVFHKGVTHVSEKSANSIRYPDLESKVKTESVVLKTDLQHELKKRAKF